MKIFLGGSLFIERGEALVAGLLALLCGYLFIKYEAFDHFARFVIRHEDWQLDEIISVLFVLALGSLILLYRRSRSMRREIGRRERAEQRAHALARHDPLTGLPNRRHFNEKLKAALEEVAKSARECAVFLIDLDQFKSVNDVHGHAVGDALLVQVAARIASVCEPGTTLARLGGDEFACVFTYPVGEDTPLRSARQIVRALRIPFEVGEIRLNANATVGVSRCPADATAPGELLRSADIAMYEGKRAGRGVYRIFQAEMDTRLRERSLIETDLKAALEQGEIKAYFQPIVALDDDRIIGFEALARWEHPVRGLIGPGVFIPIAEDLGIIDKLSYRIMREACIAARDWPPHTSLSVNISPLQLKDSWLPARLLAILAETGFQPGRLIIEVTENAIIDDMDQAAKAFTSLHNAGVRIALDDFGKGYSSLYHLRQLRFDHLKIDSSFVLSMDSAESEKIVRAIAGLGKSLGMPVTAEGVETANSARMLRGFGCEQAQGYLFGAPVDAAGTRELLASPMPGRVVPFKKLA